MKLYDFVVKKLQQADHFLSAKECIEGYIPPKGGKTPEATFLAHVSSDKRILRIGSKFWLASRGEELILAPRPIQSYTVKMIIEEKFCANSKEEAIEQAMVAYDLICPLPRRQGTQVVNCEVVNIEPLSEEEASKLESQ